MKYKLLRFSLLSMLLMLFGGSVFAATTWIKTDPSALKSGDVVAIVDLTSGRAMANTGGTGSAPSATEVSISSDKESVSSITDALQWVVTVSSGSYQFGVTGTDNYLYCTNTNNGVRVGTNENNTFQMKKADANSEEDFLFNTATSRYVGVYNNQDFRCYPTVNNNIKNSVTAFYKKTEDASDTRVATTVTLAGGYATSGAVGSTLDLPTSTVNAGETAIDGATVTWTSSDESVATISGSTISLLKAGTTTIKAEFTGDETNYLGSNASYSLSVYSAYSSLQALQEAVTPTSTPVQITFNNVQVTAVKGSNAYLADTDGYGALVFTSGHGLNAGQILNGTIKANFMLYRGATEITDFDASSLTITEGSLTPTEKAIDAITAANQSTLVTLKNVTYDATAKTFSDGNNTITYYDNFSASPTLEDGKVYDVTGIIVLFNTTIEICPRAAEDVVETTTEVTSFRDIKADLTQLQALATESNVYISVAEDGTISQTDDAENAAATLKGKWHGTSYGWSDFTASVSVEGTVKITYATHDYGNDITVTNAEGTEVAKLNTVGAKWSSNHDNVVSAYYRVNEPTTLHFSNAKYNPYFAVEAIDPADIPAEVTSYYITFSAGDAEGVAPADIEVEDGNTVKLPKNYTLYKEGSTLTGWTDGSNTYAAGETVTPTGDLTLTPVFTANTVSLADRTEAVTVNWNLEPQAGVTAIKLEGKTGFRVAQASVNGNIIDVKMDIDATSGKLNNDGRSSWCQANKGTKFTLPSCKGATVAMKGYSAFGADGKTATTIDGQSEYTSSTDLSYEIASKNETVEVVLGDDCGYLSYIKIVLPVVESEVKERAIIDTDFQDWTKSSTQSIISTNFSNEEITFTYVNTSVDPEATNEGKFPTSTDAAYKGYILADKKEATVTTSVFKNITKVRYRHGATGSNRGWGLKIKVGDGEWQIISDATTGSTAWVEKDINANNVQLQWYNLNTGQNAYMFELEVYANVEISAEQVTLTTTVSPENAGTVSVYPNSSEYDKDTEVKLTATDNFGYNFKQWTKDGEVLGTEPVLNYIIAETGTITAEFETAQTYELKLDVEGTNSYMVAINPEPTIVDGKKMYEEGTTVTLTASSYENLVTFNNWSDGQTSSEITLTMTEDKDITALYSEADIIAGWDFFTSGGNGRVADFASEENTAAALSLVNTESGETSAWLDKSTEAAGGYESMKGAAVNWRQGSTEGDVGNWHWQTKVNAEAFSDINIQFDMLYNFNAYQTYNVEYSLDGENWETVGSITMTGPKAVASFNKSLPADANNQPVLYIRMIADKNSKIDGSSSKNDGNALAMFFITGSPKLIDDGQAPVLVSTVPVDGATGVSASGKIVLTFDESVKLADGVVAYINNSYIKSNTQNPTKGIVNGKTITFEYKDFEYDTPYNFILAGKSVADLTDNYITEAITLSFTTMARPTVEKALYDFVVPDDGTLKAAIDAANNRADKSTRYRIFVKKGEYKMPTGANKHYKHTNNDGSVTYWEGDLPDPITYVKAANISLIGEDRDATIVTQDISNDEDMLFDGQFGKAHKYEEIKNSAVLQLEGSATGIYFQDITIKSGINDALGRNLAVYDKSSKNIYKNTLLYGYQDTWNSDNNRGLYYFEDGQVRGRTDYLCGKGDAYFNGVELLQVKGGYAAVPSTPANVGWVFNGCTISASGSDVNGNYTLGRPWGQGTPVAVFIDTKMNVLPSPIGWNEMSNGWPKRFAEYNSMTASGSAVDLSGRKTTFGDGHPNNPVLTAEEAAQYRDMNNMFGDWNPKLQTEQSPVPTNVKIDGTTLTWDDSNYVFCWAICKDGNVVGFATEPSYTISGEGTWTVRAANEMGGLSEASAKASDASGILQIEKANENTRSDYFNTAGQRVSNSFKGIVIINGKKYVK